METTAPQQGITEEQAILALHSWLTQCLCENPEHDTEDAKMQKYDNKLYLRPAINRELKSDLRWLLDNASYCQSTKEFVSKVRDIIIFNRQEYDYKKHVPILCEECARSRGFTVDTVWPIVSQPDYRCSKCGNYWRPMDDSVPGAYIELEDGQPICLVCFLKESLQDEVQKYRQKQLRENMKLINPNKQEESTSLSRKEQRKIWRERNEEILANTLQEGSCKKCGEAEDSELDIITTEESPKGKVSNWRRDNSPEVFQSKLSTCVIICHDCLKDEKAVERIRKRKN